MSHTSGLAAAIRGSTGKYQYEDEEYRLADIDFLDKKGIVVVFFDFLVHTLVLTKFVVLYIYE